MKEICLKKGKAAKINSREMRFLNFFFRLQKLVPAKISSLKVDKNTTTFDRTLKNNSYNNDINNIEHFSTFSNFE